MPFFFFSPGKMLPIQTDFWYDFGRALINFAINKELAYANGVHEVEVDPNKHLTFKF